MSSVTEADLKRDGNNEVLRFEGLSDRKRERFSRMWYIISFTPQCHHPTSSNPFSISSTNGTRVWIAKFSISKILLIPRHPSLLPLHSRQFSTYLSSNTPPEESSNAKPLFVTVSFPYPYHTYARLGRHELGRLEWITKHRTKDRTKPRGPRNPAFSCAIDLDRVKLDGREKEKKHYRNYKPTMLRWSWSMVDEESWARTTVTWVGIQGFSVNHLLEQEGHLLADD